MKQFYKLFKNEKVSAMPTQLTWSHYTELLVLKDFKEINYYIVISLQQNLTYRQLHDKIKSYEYKRLVTELKNEHIGQIEIHMNYIDKTIKKINQDRTIGIIKRNIIKYFLFVLIFLFFHKFLLFVFRILYLLDDNIFYFLVYLASIAVLQKLLYNHVGKCSL